MLDRTSIMGGLLGWFANLLHPYRPTPQPPTPTPQPPGPPSPAPLPSSALALYQAINAARAAHGLAPLVRDPLLSASAAAWAAQMAATGVLAHGDFETRIATLAPNKAAGEDIGSGFASAADEVTGWVNHPPHREILMGDFDTVGVGVGVASDGGLWFTADFVREETN